MSIVITSEFVKQAKQNSNQNSAECILLAEKLKVHAEGRCPETLIKKRRPNESEQTFDYRKQIFIPRTQEAITKVINSLQKIRKSQDWNIQYYNDKVSKKIANGENLQDYCEKNYPGYTSITNWAFSELLQRSLLDANSVCAVVLKSLPEKANEYQKPEIEMFGSEQIISFVPNQYYLLKSADVYVSPNNKNITGIIYYVITDTQIARYVEISGNISEQYLFNHNIGEIPVCKVGGVFSARKNNDTIQKSRIASMVPFLEEATREYSDFQAEMVQHIYSEKIVFTNSECKKCNGTGSTHDDEGERHECKHCGGSGRVVSSPYGVYKFDPQKLGDVPFPTKLVEYIGKDIGIARFLSEHVDENIYKALSSVNMEFLAQTPLNQSGTAKEIDRDELSNFVNSIAEDIVMVLDNCYKFINEYRYSIIVPDKEERSAMLPSISVPERFELLNSNILMQEINTAKTGKINPVLIKNLEIEFARKKYNYDPKVSEELTTIFELDPFYGYEQADKMTMLANNGITETDYIVSCNIAQFVQRAEKETDNFFEKSFAEKRKIIQGYADEIIKTNSEKELIQKTVVEDLL
jgi:hypothetical protein